MNDTRPADLIAHIRQAALDAQSFVINFDREQFEVDKKHSRQLYTVCL